MGDAKLDGTETGGKGLGFEAVGADQAAIATLVGAGLGDSGALLNHGLVDKEAQALGKAGRALGSLELQNAVQMIRVNLVGHVCVFVGCVLSHPNRKPHWPIPANFVQAPSGVDCARLAFTSSSPDEALRS